MKKPSLSMRASLSARRIVPRGSMTTSDYYRSIDYYRLGYMRGFAAAKRVVNKGGRSE